MQGLAQISARRGWPAVLAVATLWVGCGQLMGCAQSVPVSGALSADAAASQTGASGASGTTSSGTGSGTGSTTPVSTATATPLAIQGSPPSAVVAGTAYAFQPSVSATTTTVTFTIANQPAWAHFDPTTGALSGTPTLADVGVTANITITANDAGGAATIGPFDITVTASSGSPTSNPPGTATLTWVAPSRNTNGTELTDLAGYRIYYGTRETQLDREILLSSASATTYVINNLSPGTYYFVVAALSSEGTESAQSNVVSKTI